MQAFDPVAAGVALGAEVLRLGQSLRKLTKGTRNAQNEIKDLSKEMDMFADLYEEFFRVCIFDPTTFDCAKSPAKRLVAWTQEVIDAFRDLLDRIQDLIDISKDSIVDVLAARMKWHSIDKEMKYMRLSLSMARQGIKGLTNIRMFEKLEEEEEDMSRIAMERRERQGLEERFGMTLEDRVKTLKYMRYNCRKQRHVIEHRVKETKAELLQQYDKTSRASDIVPEPRRLFRFMRSVEKYVDNVLPAKESGRRRNRSDLEAARQVSGSNMSLTPAALDVTATSTSTLSSSRSHFTAGTRFAPEDRSEPSSGRTQCSSTRVHVEKYKRMSDFNANLVALPELTEVPGLADRFSQENHLTVSERFHDATNYRRKPHYSCASPTQSLPSDDVGVFLEARSNDGDTKSDLHETTSSIASEDFETWWQTRGIPEPDAFTALEQKAQLFNGNHGYDDVSSEEEIENTHWRAGHERSVSPENAQVP